VRDRALAAIDDFLAASCRRGLRRMDGRFDIAVVGAACGGIARRCARPGARVLLLEAEAQPAIMPPALCRFLDGELWRTGGPAADHGFWPFLKENGFLVPRGALTLAATGRNAGSRHSPRGSRRLAFRSNCSAAARLKPAFPG